MLHCLTHLVNLVALAAGLWLGLYVVTRGTVSLRDSLACARTAVTTTLRAQFHVLILATLLGSSVDLVSLAGSSLGVPVPMLAPSLLLAAGMVLIGYGVARYSALVEGRTNTRDFFHSALATSLVIVAYLSLAQFAIVYIGMPPVLRAVALIVAVSTHFLVDSFRYQHDSSLYRRDLRQLQATLRRRLAGDREDLDHILSVALESLCTCAQAIFGLIAVFENEHVRVAALHGWLTGEMDVSCEGLAADDVLHLQPGQLPPPLAEAALLIPLYGPAQQQGALILGRPRNGVGFSPEDVDQLLYPSDRLSDIIWSAHRKAEYAARVTQGVDLAPPKNVSHPAQVSVEAVDDALRHMSSSGYLGQHPLARLRVVQARLAGGAVTHIDLGKAVYGMLAAGIEKLPRGPHRPQHPPPGSGTHT